MDTLIVWFTGEQEGLTWTITESAAKLSPVATLFGIPLTIIEYVVVSDGETLVEPVLPEAPKFDWLTGDEALVLVPLQARVVEPPPLIATELSLPPAVRFTVGLAIAYETPID